MIARPSPLLISLGLALLVACQSAGSRPGVRIVEPAGNPQQWHFDPASITVKLGETVSWTNTGQEFHTVTADDNKSFDSGVVNPGVTFLRMFGQAGRYPYHCDFHPWMKGTVQVGG